MSIYIYIYTHYLKLPIATNFVTENVARVYNFQAKTLNLRIPKTNQEMQKIQLFSSILVQNTHQLLRSITTLLLIVRAFFSKYMY